MRSNRELANQILAMEQQLVVEYDRRVKAEQTARTAAGEVEKLVAELVRLKGSCKCSGG